MRLCINGFRFALQSRAAWLARVVRALACAGAALASFSAPASATSFGSVTVTIPSAALSSASYLLWTFEFGIAPGGGANSTPANVVVTTGSNVLWGTPTSTVPSTVNGFYGSSSTVAIGNYNQFSAKTGATLGADYNKVLFLNYVSPSTTPIVFTLNDPPGPTSTPLGIHIAGPNGGGNLLDLSFLFGGDGSFALTGSSHASGVTVTEQLVPEPGTAALLLTGLAVTAARVSRRR